MSDTSLRIGGQGIEDQGIAEFLDLARSANVFLEPVRGRLTIRAVNPNWAMWKPIRHMLDEIGPKAIEAYLLRTTPADRRPASLELVAPRRAAG